MWFASATAFESLTNVLLTSTHCTFPAVDKCPSCARLLTVASASHLSTASPVGSVSADISNLRDL